MADPAAGRSTQEDQAELPDLDFWPEADLSLANLTWLDQAEPLSKMDPLVAVNGSQVKDNRRLNRGGGDLDLERVS